MPTKANNSVSTSTHRGRPPIRVMIVEDSQTAQQWLAGLIDADPRLRVVSIVPSGERALAELDRVRPDVISLDIHLPGINGIATTREVMTHRPTPIVVCSASTRSRDSRLSMEALQAGALTVVEKPSGLRRDEMGASLCEQLVRMSDVHLVRRRIGAHTPSPPSREAPLTPAGSPTAIGFVSSTGGPGALARVLGELPGDVPFSILLVQHISPSFFDGFVSWLDGVGPLHAVPARLGDTPRPGHIHVAPPGSHTTLVRGRFAMTPPHPDDLNVPSGAELLSSMARDLGARAMGVVLTGMGDDGAAGLLDIRNAGGFTIAEHESTAVVNGMPRVAIALGAACRVCPVHEIAAELLRVCAEGEVTA
ncbi:MAG: chemotaxis protein CheB [Phycisphaerales bacterium]